jgi:succinoglycan biosynthesis transport protein ExoP
MRTEMKTLTADFSSVALLDDTAAKWQERRVRSSFAAMRRRAWLIVVFGCVGLGGAAMWLNFAKPQYSATALVQLDTGNKFSNFDTVVTSPREGDPDAIRTEVEVLRSNAVVERVVHALDLTNDPEFSPPPTTWRARLADLLPAELETFFSSLGMNIRHGGSGVPSGSRDTDAGTPNQVAGPGHPAQKGTRTTVLTNNNGVVLGSIADDAASSAGRLQDSLDSDKLALTIQQVRKNLSVEDNRRSYIIAIALAASSAEKAARLANAFAEQYLAARIDAKLVLTASANEWAKTQLDAAGEQLRTAEAAIEQFRAQHNAIIEVAPGNSVAVSQQLAQLLSSLNVQLAAAAQARIAAETRLAAAKELMKRRDVYAIPDVLGSPLIQQLRIDEARAAARLANSQVIVGSQYPNRRALESELATLRASIGANVAQIASNLESNARDAREREQELASKVESLRRELGDASQQQLQLSILERRAEGRRTFYGALEKRYAETSALMHGVYPNARVASRATPQPLPSWPNIPIVLTAGLLLGAALGAAIVALIELADKSFRTPTQLEEATGLACLGILPELSRGFRRASGDNLFAASTRIFRESVRTIHIALDAAIGVNSQKRSRVVLVTSALPREGKTISSVALATALAASGSKTLLIDADLRRPEVDAYLAGASRSRGLASILDDEGYPAATEIDKDLYVIRGGVSDESAQRVFLSTQFGTFLEAAKAQFDSIVIDSPPAVVVADAAILARFADVVLHVVRWGQTRRSDVLDAVDRMHRANGKAVGVTVLNRVSPAKYSKYNRDGSSGFRYADYYRAATTTTAAKQ